MSTRSPRLTLVPPAVPNHVHDPMQDGRNQDDEPEPPDRLAGPEAGEPPGGHEEDQNEEHANQEVVLVEPRRLRAARQPETAFHEGAEEVSEERAHREEDEDPEDAGPLAEGEAGARERAEQGEDPAESETGRDAAREAPPCLPVPEDAATVPHRAAEIHGRAAAEYDRHGVRDVRGEEEPEREEGLLEGHGGRNAGGR